MNFFLKVLSFLILLFFEIEGSSFAQIPPSGGGGAKDAQLADQYLSSYEFEKAAALYEKAYARDPLGVYSNYLRCLIAMKDYNEAEKLVKKTIKKNATNQSYQIDLGTVYELQGDQNKAKQVYDK